MILIVSSVADAHARHVAGQLLELGREVRFLDTSRLGVDAFLTHRLGPYRRAESRTVGDAATELDDVATVWYRRAWLPRIAEAMTDDDDRSFSLREWAQLIDGALLSLTAQFVNPVVAHRACVKPRQLCAAQQVGLAVPDTLITNDSRAVEEFLEHHRNRVVHKSLTAPGHHFVETRRWADTDPAALADLAFAPTIFQAEVEGTSDVRVTVVGERVFAAAVIRSGAGPDSRLDLDAPYVPHTLPPGVSAALLTLMDRLGLVYGTVDMRISRAGEYIFFEVNPQGQYLFVEIRTGLPITDALVDLLSAS